LITAFTFPHAELNKKIIANTINSKQSSKVARWIQGT